MAIEPYLNLVTSQHYNKVKFMSWLSAVLQKVDDVLEVTNAIPEAFDVNKAVGVQLDTVGELVGRSRYLPFQLTDGSSPVLDDTNYRIALKAKIAQNQWDGTLPQIYDVWNSLFPNAQLIIKDNQDMTMDAKIRGDLGLQSVTLVTVGYIIPKPSGVRLNVKWESEITRRDYLGMIVTERDTVQLTFPNPEL
ncbi:DUF2612 domain-containing protein [Brevibacillus borstelensis]|uniref:DUF2612 domain-containing protein n=1 Tax=Brevibacillus borstelensis TaxID=45462 RepID=UPI00287FEA4D|nr:DUF2612 domain-containing protein [Brevibacillus borstelensis]WNF07279.1 DUF2612 domain-containing protein [Brevibacillus borstelensis]